MARHRMTLVGMFVVLAGGLLAGCTTAPEPPPAGPDTAAIGDVAAVDLPAAADPGAVRAYLTGPGAPAAQVVPATEELWRTGQPGCAPVATRLQELGSPAALLDLALAVPDQDTADLLVDMQAATGRLLGACSSQDFAARQDDFAWQWALARRRLTEIGVG